MKPSVEYSLTSEKLNILLLVDYGTTHIGTICDHIESIKAKSRHRILVADTLSFDRLGQSIEHFDVIVLHYSIIISSASYLPDKLRSKIELYQGLKVAFIQDEYRWIDATANTLYNLGINILFSVVNKEVVEQIYHHPQLKKMRKETTLTGYVSEQLTKRPVPSYNNRPVDVGYRARKVPAWLGSFAYEKYLIGQRFMKDAKKFELKCDISHEENRRLYGEKWIDFISNCKAVLGTESGSSVCDFTGNIQKNVEAFEALYPNASFNKLKHKFFAKLDGAITINVISPRCFEAAALRTLMILYPGYYSGRLKPWRHYIPLNRDHSNIHEIVRILRDPAQAEQIINCAYQEVALNEENTSEALVNHFDSVVDEEFSRLKIEKSVLHLSYEKLNRKLNRIWRIRHFSILLRQRIYLFTIWLIKFLLPRQFQDPFRHFLQTIWRRQFGVALKSLTTPAITRPFHSLMGQFKK